MNKKIIKSVLRKQFNNWVNSIEDPIVAALVKQNTIITGGAITSMLLNEEVKDYDIYFRNKETVLAVSNYYCDQFNSRKQIGKKDCVNKAYVFDCGDPLQVKEAFEGVDTNQILPGHLYNLEEDRVKIVIRSEGVAAEDDNVLEEPFEDVFDVLESTEDILDLPAEMLEEVGEKAPKKPYRPVFLSSNAITLSDKIQLVVRFYGEPEDIHKNYDFVHCTNSWTSWDNHLTLRQEALESILSKQLFYSGSKYPLCSVIRTRKFIKRGWHINAGQYLKMLFQVSKLDLTDINTLEDQLVGVDSSYFVHLIDALRNKKLKNENFKVEETYVAKIIDRIF